jgi:hypothetical protein
MQQFDHNIGFWEKRQFFAENCPKSQKIVIITSTPVFLKKLCNAQLQLWTKLDHMFGLKLIKKTSQSKQLPKRATTRPIWSPCLERWWWWGRWRWKVFVFILRKFSLGFRHQGCQISPATPYQNGKSITNDQQNIPNGHKIYQMAVKRTN